MTLTTAENELSIVIELILLFILSFFLDYSFSIWGTKSAYLNCPLMVFDTTVLCPQPGKETMTNTKFLVKVNRSGTRAPEYVQRIDRTPIQTTTNRKLALAMGRFTAEDAVKSIQNSRCNPELVSVQVSAQ